ncbi:MAG: hypothetical protein MUD12_06905 [Spirochaetes bacterium]|jgi:hypothetical protein|nr:hypothetical protein [Spirochaetota bacterium]
MKKTKGIILSLLSLAVLSCSSGNYREIIAVPEKLFLEGKYLEAARTLLPQINSRNKNHLLLLMEAGSMLHAGGEYEKSNKVLLEASKIAKIIPVSVSEQASSLLLDETTTSYRGEDFEKVLIHMYMGLNYLLMKDYASARVSFQAVNEQLAKIKNENGLPKYKQNIMAKYLTAMAYEISGDMENDKDDLEFAYIEFKQINQLMPNLDMVKTDLLRLSKKLGYMDDFQQWSAKFRRNLALSENSGELVLIFESGLCPIKVSRGKLLSDPDMKAAIIISLNSPGALAAGVTVAAVLATLGTSENPIPDFVKRSNQTSYVRMISRNGMQNTVMLENVENTATETLKDDYSRLRAKVAASVAIKAAAAVGAGYAAKKLAESSKKTQGFASLIGAGVGLITGAVLFSQVRPDLRCWHTLPANLQMSRVFLPPGKHDIRLDFVGGGNNTVNTKSVTVEIKKGEKIFINERTLN